jgi:DNA polymerase-3 subunit gamma/tau
VIEIDAASNTGVDNIRELIERAQFAPAQCRYKVYVIDECLTGDSLVLTQDGLVRIDNPTIKDKKVLSYNDITGAWEFKKVLRWLAQGERQTIAIETTHCKIKCTSNHLIRTEQGWIPAKNVKEGTKILSPVNAGVALLSTNSEQIGAFADSSEVTNSKKIPSDRSLIIRNLFLSKPNFCARFVLVDVVKSLMFLSFCNKRAEALRAFSLTGHGIHTSRSMDSGTLELRNFLPMQKFYNPIFWDSFMEPCWEIAPSPTRIAAVDSPDFVGLTERINKSGWNIKPSISQNYVQSLELPSTLDMAKHPFVAIQSAIPSLQRSSSLSSLTNRESQCLRAGLIGLPKRAWLGGTWMMGHLVSVLQEVRKFNCIQKDTLWKKISSWLNGSQEWITQLKQSLTEEQPQARLITISIWGQTPLANGCQTSNSTQSPQWITSLETVKSVSLAGVEQVYDIEVEDNHNFVANGLTVHNCHMLSTAAFNALLKTLEEPPPRVVFVLATTDLQRVLPTIISRCQKFDFRRIALEAMVNHLGAIADKEQIDIVPEGIQLVGQLAQGGLRDAESLLDQLSLLPGTVTLEAVWDLVGVVPEQSLLQLAIAIAQGHSEQVIDTARQLLDRGREPLVVLQNLAGFYRDMLIAKTAPNRQDLVTITAQTWLQLCEFVQPLDLSIILAGQQHLRTAELQIKNTSQPRLWLEVTLLGLLPAAIAPASQVVPVMTSPTPIVVPGQTPSNQTLKQISEQSQSPPVSQEQPSTSPESSIHTQEDSSPSTPSSPEPSPSPAVPDVAEIWNTVIAQVQPYSSQVMVRQQCRLLGFKGQQARVGVTTQPLLKMAQTKLPNIEAAFEKVFSRKVKVSLEVISHPEPEAPANPEPPIPSSNSAEDVSQAPTESNYLSNPVIVDPPRSTPTTPASLNPASTNQISSPVVPASPPVEVSSVEVSAPETGPTFHNPVWEDDDEVTKAAKNLAAFFRGKVVSLDDDPEVPLLINQEATLTEWDESGSDNEDGSL